VVQRIVVPADILPGTYNWQYLNESTTALLPGSLRVVTQPQVNSDPIRDAATSRALAAYAPGQIISIAGSDFTVSDFTADPGALPTQAGSVSVTIGDRFALLVSVSSTQLVVQIPYEATGDSADLTVITGTSSRTAPIKVPLQGTAPSLFASASKSGAELTFLATGLGILKNGSGEALPSGIAGDSNYRPADPPVIEINGAATEVTAVEASEFPGRVRIRVRLGAEPESGFTFSTVLRIGASASDRTMLTVQ
jgi:uncharacterized protein (TIGR03437 family)